MACKGHLYGPVSDASISASQRQYKVLFAVTCDECEHADNIVGLLATGGIPFADHPTAQLPIYGSTYARFKETAPDCPDTDFNNPCDASLAYCDNFVRLLDYRVREPNREECRTMAERGYPCCTGDAPPCVLWMVEAMFRTMDIPTGRDLTPEPVNWCPSVSKKTVGAMYQRNEKMTFDGYGLMKTIPLTEECNDCQDYFENPLERISNPCFGMDIGYCTYPINSAEDLFTDVQQQIARHDIEISYSDFIVSYGDGGATQLCFPDMVNADDILINVQCHAFVQKIPAGWGKLISLSLDPEQRVINGVEVRYLRRSFVWRVNPRGWCINAPNRGLKRCLGKGAPDGAGGTIEDEPAEGRAKTGNIIDDADTQSVITEPEFLNDQGQPIDIYEPQPGQRFQAFPIMRWCPKQYSMAAMINSLGASGVNPDNSPWLSATAATP